VVCIATKSGYEYVIIVVEIQITAALYLAMISLEYWLGFVFEKSAVHHLLKRMNPLLPSPANIHNTWKEKLTKWETRP
jgi:hypothetical protein